MGVPWTLDPVLKRWVAGGMEMRTALLHPVGTEVRAKRLFHVFSEYHRTRISLCIEKKERG